ncbi:hypothetical protein CYMTET_22060 [Cymbomonas tetramitiformis]|uniref:Uncharacterized protein n=1 Tax=Cymbomonas tetramitiformis TaxID=36881 RepID=A0AAE0G0Z3_9CHLO|nr:hypothetical protein CYMTET_22060 [Cymbomonas tetramitiformis]|eukprot:gene5111-6216_t
MDSEEYARNLFTSKEYSRAAAEYAKLSLADPTQPKFLTNRAICLLNLKKYTSAIKLCIDAVAMDATWSRAYECHSKCLRAVGRLHDAVDILEKGMLNVASSAIEKELGTLKSLVFQEQIAGNYDAGFASCHRINVPLNLTPSDKRIIKEVKFDFLETERASQLEIRGEVNAAAKVYEIQAELGCTRAMAALSKLERTADPTKAVHWARRCVERGPSEFYQLMLGGTDPSVGSAQEFLGTCYRHGLGVEKSLAEAEQWLRLGAEGGDALAMNNLGTFLVEHQSDEEQAMDWYRRASDAGCTRAKLNLGINLMKGRGCVLNFAEAEAYLKSALDCGDLLAIPQLQNLIRLRGAAGKERIAALLALLKVLQDAKAKEEHRGGLQAPTMVMEAELLLSLQHEEDADKANEAYIVELSACDCSPLGFAEFSREARSQTTVDKYRQYLQELLQARRQLTSREVNAAKLIESAVDKCPGPSIANLCNNVGKMFMNKGLKAEGLRYFCYSADVGDSEGCFLAGHHLSQSTSAKELRRAKSFLKRAASRGHERATRELDKLHEHLRSTKLEAETAPDCHTTFDTLACLSSRINSAVSKVRLNKPEETAKVFEELLATAHIALAAGTPDGHGNPKVPGTAIDHLQIMGDYVMANPGSYSGHSMYCSLRHYMSAILFMDRKDYESAVHELFLAYLFDEKGVTIPYEVDLRTGQPNLGSPFTEFFSYVDSELRESPRSLRLVVIKLFSSPDLEQRVIYANRAVELSTPQLAPRLLFTQGCMAAFCQRSAAAKQCFLKALQALRRDESYSLWPYYPSDAFIGMARAREIMAATIQLHVGRILLCGRTLEDLREAEDLIREFQRKAPTDTHGYCESCADLSEALLGLSTRRRNMSIDTGLLQELQWLVKESDRLMQLRLPIWRPLRPEDFPKLEQLKSYTKALSHSFA